MKTKSANCKTCKRKTIHEEFDDRAISGGKSVALFLFTGLPIPLRKGRNYYCKVCGTPES